MKLKLNIKIFLLCLFAAANLLAQQVIITPFTQVLDSARVKQRYRFTKLDTANCRVVYVDNNKRAKIKFNIQKQRGRAFKLFNRAGSVAAWGNLDASKTVSFDFTLRSYGEYFIFVYGDAKKIIFKRKIVYLAEQNAPILKAKRR